ncbi:DUF4349 domain-containing protein [Erythrobacter sp. HA6-11]
MRKSLLLFGISALALAGCSQEGGDAVYENVAVATADSEVVEEASPAIEAQRTGSEAANDIEPQSATAAPQIAYRYALGFRLPAAAIKPLQSKHADMCEARGPSVCRIISMQQADQDGEYAYGSLQIAVAAKSARAFSKELEASSEGAEATLISSSIQGEDLSKQIVDTEARLRARTLLRDRLMEVLRTRKGTVAELVEAERGVAQVNQEIDQARSWLNEVRGRVAFSQMSISYESGARVTGGFSEPIRSAWGSLGGILGSMIAFLMVATTVILPLGLLAWLGFKLWKRVRKEPKAAPES